MGEHPQPRFQRQRPHVVGVYKAARQHRRLQRRQCLGRGRSVDAALRSRRPACLFKHGCGKSKPKGKPHLNFTYYRLSRDHGRTWSTPRQLKYESGSGFRSARSAQRRVHFQEHCLPAAEYRSQLSNGTLVLCAGNVPNRQSKQKGVKGEEMGAVCFMGRWNAAKDDYDWTAGEPVFISPKQSSRGLMETNVAELRDGRLLVVWRASNAGLKDPAEADAAGHKLFSLSTDGGKTLTPVAEWKYDDGSPFYSPSSFHRLFGIMEMASCIGSATSAPTRPNGNHPRYPLVIAEVDESQSGAQEKHRHVDRRSSRRVFGACFSCRIFRSWRIPKNHTIELLMVDYDGGLTTASRAAATATSTRWSFRNSVISRSRTLAKHELSTSNYRLHWLVAAGRQCWPPRSRSRLIWRSCLPRRRARSTSPRTFSRCWPNGATNVTAPTHKNPACDSIRRKAALAGRRQWAGACVGPKHEEPVDSSGGRVRRRKSVACRPKIRATH